MAYRARLESVSAPKGHRGFKSHPLRHFCVPAEREGRVEGGVEEVAGEGVGGGEFGGGVAGEEGDGGHSGAVGGFDAGGGVLDYQALAGWNAEFGDGGQEYLGVGLAAGDVRARHDGAEEGGKADRKSTRLNSSHNA